MQSAPYSRIKHPEDAQVVATVTDEQFAARALVRDWARNPPSGPGGTEAVRDIERGDADAWRPVFAGLADLGLFGVAIPEDRGGAGGSLGGLWAVGGGGGKGGGAG